MPSSTLSRYFIRRARGRYFGSSDLDILSVVAARIARLGRKKEATGSGWLDTASGLPGPRHLIWERSTSDCAALSTRL